MDQTWGIYSDKQKVPNFNNKENLKVQKCQTQVYSWFNYFYDNIEYVLESPLNNSKNRNRILKIKNFFHKEISVDAINNEYYNKNKLEEDLKKINMTREEYEKWLNNYVENYNNKNNIKIQTKKDRPSPSESATKFKVGTKKKGNDGNMWIIVENKNGVKRWSKIKN